MGKNLKLIFTGCCSVYSECLWIEFKIMFMLLRYLFVMFYMCHIVLLAFFKEVKDDLFLGLREVNSIWIYCNMLKAIVYEMLYVFARFLFEYLSKSFMSNLFDDNECEGCPFSLT